MTTTDLQETIERWFSAGAAAVSERQAKEAFLELRTALEKGEARAADPDPASPTGWRVNAWVKQGILLGFRIGQLESSGDGLSFVDKDTFPARRFTAEQTIRVVPGGTAVRAGAYVAPGVDVMPPSYVNVGAWVDEG